MRGERFILATELRTTHRFFNINSSFIVNYLLFIPRNDNKYRSNTYKERNTDPLEFSQEKDSLTDLIKSFFNNNRATILRINGLTSQICFVRVTRRAQTINYLTLASLLVAVEEVVGLLLTGPLEVQGEDDHGWCQCGEDESAVIDAESLFVICLFEMSDIS